MLGKTLVNLGKLTKEQKEQTWKESISGSQAWMLINEPYNLIRDKLGIERIHKSKYDFFDTKKGKSIGDNAKAQGHLYEPVVIEELKLFKPEIEYTDETFKIDYTWNGQPVDYMKVTCTPDWYIKQNDKITQFGDIKNTTSAEDEDILMERYYYQLLHNAYVLGCNSAELNAKGYTSRPVNTYQVFFTPEELQDYENKLITFFNNLVNKNVEAYDELFIQQQADKGVKKEGTNFKDPVTRVAEEPEKELLERLAYLKEQQKAIKAEIELIEERYKEDYDFITVVFGDKTFTMKSVERRGSVDYAKAIPVICEEYSIPESRFNEFRKPSSVSKTITIK